MAKEKKKMRENRNERVTTNVILILGLIMILLIGSWAFLSDDFFVEVKNENQLEEEVVNQLVLDSRVDYEEINVDARGSEVILSGDVESYSAYRAAELAARSVSGVNQVTNNLVLSYNDIDTDRDELERIIANKFLYDSDLEQYDITVDVNDNVATLTGEVDALWKKEYAGDLTLNTLGITNVENDLLIVPTEDYDDELVADKIQTALDTNDFINSDAINIKVEEGIVTLTGEVDTFMEYDMVEDEVSLIDGVVLLNNDLAVI